jgi:fructokinase
MFLVCGEAVIDFFQDAKVPDLAFRGRPAGSPFNVCIGLARLGARAALLTGLSRDPFGERLVQAMEREGVEWRLCPRTDRPTILAFVLVRPDGGPEYAFYGERGADTDVTEAGLPALPQQIEAVHVGGFPMAVEPARSAYAALIRREAAGRFVSLDPNVRAALMGDLPAFVRHFEGLCPSAALIKASTEDIAQMYPGEEALAVAERWRGLGAATVVVTDGPNGASAWNAAGRAFAPTAPVAVVDTVGAGDSFMAALLAAFKERGLLSRAALAATPAEALAPLLAFANAAAGITCGRQGADPPRRAEIPAPW